MKNKAYYWTFSSIKNVLLTVLMCSLYGVMMYIGNNEDSIIEFISETIIVYYMIVSIALVAVFCNTTIPLMINTVLSLGSTRKDTFKHINIFILLTTALYAVILVVLGLFTINDILDFARAILTYISCLYFSSGMGLLGGAHTLKKGSKLGLTYFLTGFIGVLISVGIIFISGTAAILTRGSFTGELNKYEFLTSTLAGVLAIIVFIISQIRMKKQLNIQEVRI